ncbi:MAG: glycosyltransferase family 9 protein [Pseudomonadota bacterium]
MRAAVIGRALLHLISTYGRRKRPSNPQRILVAHHLLLGDTLMLTPLLAKLRHQFPDAEIIMTTPKAIAPLYDKHPYGVTAWPFDPRDAATAQAMFPYSGFDLAIVPGDNRHSWFAAALNARWIIAHAKDKPTYKNRPVDELIEYPSTPAAWGDMVAALVDGPPPPPYDVSQWPAPNCIPFTRPQKPYAVLHVGASTPLKLWEPQKWQALATQLSKRGLQVIWSGGKNEGKIVKAIDPTGEYKSYAGALDLSQLWQLIAGAKLLVCPDTGVAHLGRITNTPTVTLFGPGSALICGSGEFWRHSPYRAVTIENFPCRDQKILFRREIDWVKRCGRSTRECASPRCMQAITVEQVFEAVEQMAF